MLNLKTWPLFVGVGIVGLFFYLFILILGVVNIILNGSGNFIDSVTAPTWMAVVVYSTPIIFLPSLIMLSLGWHGWKKDKYLMKLANVLDSHRNIHIFELSEKFNKPEKEIESDIFECINEGLIQGIIEPVSKKFIATNMPEDAIKHT